MIKQTQTFLKYFLELPATFAIDGIQGDQTNQAIRDAITKLQRKFAKEKLTWNSEFNFIGIRTDNDFDNTFDDWFIIFAYGTIIAVPASTVSGRQGVLNGAENWVNGVNGTGIIKANQQIDYLLVEPKDNTFWNPMWSGGIGFLYQDKPIYFYRDANEDGIVDTNGPIYFDNVGANCHSWLNSNSNYVENLSTMCQVTQYWFWVPLFDLMKRFAENKRITYTLLQW